MNDFIVVDSCLNQRLTLIGVLMDMSCEKYEDTLLYASENKHLDSSHKWLIISNENNATISSNTETNVAVDGVPEVLYHLNISMDADIVLSTSSTGSTECRLYDIYNFGKEHEADLLIDILGSWNLETEININDYKYYRRWNLQQQPLKLITVMLKPPKVFDPKIIMNENPTDNVPNIVRTSTIILNVLAELHNFRLIYTITDRWIGDFSRNSSKVVASSLYFRTQDISPTIRFNEDVLSRIDIIHPPVTSIETRYYYRIPTYGAGKLENQFLRPLSKGTWLCVLLLMTLCCIVLLLSAKLERRPSSGEYAVFSVMASMCQQSRELTTFITGLFCVLIYNYYTSSVVSWLLNGPPPSINSLEELLNSPLELIYEDIGYTRSWLQIPNYYYNKRNKEVEDQLRQKKVFNKKKDAPLFASLETGIAMVKSGGYAYHTEVESANRLIARYFTQAELCELGSLQSMEKANLYACLQTNSPFKEFFAWSMARLLERGIISCIQARTTSRTLKCEGSSPRPLALGGAAPAFLLLLSGYFVSFVIMLLER
ncbi:ionotropic receptor 75a-like [Aphomia sociella]